MPGPRPSRPAKPLGQTTRGKTAPNRLRKTDTFLAVAYPEFIRHMPGVYVDLGYGAAPITSVETLRRLRRLNPKLRVVGVEIDPQRVAGAQPFAEPGLEFRLGGFNLPRRAGEAVGVVRAFNVLRQYDEAAVAEALALLSEPLVPGGLILEGTSDPFGHLLAFNLFQKHPDFLPGSEPAQAAGTGLRRIALVLAPSLPAGPPASAGAAAFRPRQFQAILPKNFIHHAEPGGLIDRFFAAWQAAWQHARGRAAAPRQVFALSALRLSQHYGYNLDRRPALLRRGFLVLGPEWPAPGQTD